MNTQDELKIRDMEILFQPFHSRKLDTPTRIVLPAMTRGFSPGGVPTDEVAAYYQRRAKHEVGLIITEGTFIDEPSASPSSNYPNFFGGAPLRGWKKVLEAVHTTDCKIAPSSGTWAWRGRSRERTFPTRNFRPSGLPALT